MSCNTGNDVLSLCGDKIFRVSKIPNGVKEEKIQRILDARLPQAFAEIWKCKRKKGMEGRISVPMAVVSAHVELQQVLSSEEGCFVFLGPIKVHLCEERSGKRESTVKKKLKILEKEQNEMKALVGKLTSMLENKMQIEHQPMPSPGRDAEFVSQRKRVAPANIVRKEQKKIRVMKGCNDKKINKCEISEEELDPMIGLRLAVREAEKEIRQQVGPNKDMLHRLLQMRTERLVDKG